MKMTYGEATAKLKGYKTIHGKKLNGQWRKNPNINLLDWINHWLTLCADHDSEKECGPLVAKRVDEITRGKPQLCRSGGVALTEEEVERLMAGETINREVVIGVLAKISFRNGVKKGG